MVKVNVEDSGMLLSGKDAVVTRVGEVYEMRVDSRLVATSAVRRWLSDWAFATAGLKSVRTDDDLSVEE